MQVTGQPHHTLSQAERNSPRKRMTSKQQAERLPEAVRCNAQRSALRRPTQHAAMANATRYEKRSNEMRQVTQPILLISHRLPSWARKRTSRCPEPSFPDKNIRFHRSQITFSPFHQSQLTSTYTFLASVTEIVLTGERNDSPSWLVASKVYCRVPLAGTWK